jgi:hypothetical protein
MTSIGGPGGPGGVGGAGGPTGPAAPDAPSEIDEVAGEPRVEAAAATARATDIDALAADVAAGRLTPREAIDRLVEATAGPGLAAAERAELRELLRDLIANDPHLCGLIGRI